MNVKIQSRFVTKPSGNTSDDLNPRSAFCVLLLWAAGLTRAEVQALGLVILLFTAFGGMAQTIYQFNSTAEFSTNLVGRIPCAIGDHAAPQLLAGVDAARNRYAGFFGLGCDCFAF